MKQRERMAGLESIAVVSAEELAAASGGGWFGTIKGKFTGKGNKSKGPPDIDGAPAGKNYYGAPDPQTAPPVSSSGPSAPATTGYGRDGTFNSRQDWLNAPPNSRGP